MDNPQIDRARQIIEYTDTNLFLTGRAGTGKTTFLRRLRKESAKRMVVLAPTGIAAINAQGVTLHSFFQLSFAPFVPGGSQATQQKRYQMGKQKLKIIRSLDLLVIDEISMVRADVLDAVDDALRRYRRNGRPFGGVQLLLIGDLQQLAPVVKDEEWELLHQFYETPYFFSSRALQQTPYVTVELEKVYRQSDPQFLALLNAVREGRTDSGVLEALNRRYVPGFVPKREEGFVQLVTHNWRANEINAHELDALRQPAYSYEAVVEGIFPEMSFPTDARLTLKLGAQVMFVKNDADKRYFNGMIGEVVAIGEKGFSVRPKHGGEIIEVHPEVWDNTRYTLDEATGEIREEVEGSFSQMPVKLAWAITIHKSQGLTFEHVMIDAARSFAHGQTYVALSRCKTLEGIVLTSPIPQSAIIADADIDHFNDDMRRRQVSDEQLAAMRNAYGVHLLTDAFTFQKENDALRQVTRLLLEFLARTYGETAARYEAALRTFEVEVMQVAGRFHAQYEALVAQASGRLDDATLQERVTKGADYFHARLIALLGLVQHTHLDIDNAQTAKRMKTAFDELRPQLLIHTRLLAHIIDNGFTMADYLATRAKVMLEVEGATGSTTKGKQGSKKEAEAKLDVPEEVLHPELYRWLKSWRYALAKDEGIPAYTILTNRTMIAIANYAPTDEHTLLRMPSFGRKSFEKYGGSILDIVTKFTQYVAEGKINETPVGAEELVQAEAAKEKPAPRVPGTSARESLELFQKGMSVSDIARQRSLAASTIHGHLLQFLATGEVKSEQLIAPENLANITAYFKAHPATPDTRLSEVHEALGRAYTFEDIRTAIAVLHLKEG